MEEQDPTTDVQGDANAESARGRQYRETQGTGRRIVVGIDSIFGRTVKKIPLLVDIIMINNNDG